jgi:hypothetical protein
MSDTYDYKCSHGSSHKMKVLVYNFLTTFFLIKYFFNFKISFKFWNWVEIIGLNGQHALQEIMVYFIRKLNQKLVILTFDQFNHLIILDKLI